MLGRQSLHHLYQTARIKDTPLSSINLRHFWGGNQGDQTSTSQQFSVLTHEPPPADQPLIKAAKELDNLLVTPHCAWTAREARQRLMDEVVKNILAFTKGQERNRIA